MIETKGIELLNPKLGEYSIETIPESLKQMDDLHVPRNHNQGLQTSWYLTFFFVQPQTIILPSQIRPNKQL